MRDVGTVNTNTKLFGCKLDLPIYISPTWAARMSGPEGEIALAQGAAASGIIHCVVTPASFPHDEILQATPQHAFFQLYVNKERQKSEGAIRQAMASRKVKALFVTVDVPVISKREADERIRSSGAPDGGFVRRASSFIDLTLTWRDLAWLRSITDAPIVVKGIQRSADAILAMRYGCQGLVLSNHGGRAADTAPPAILTLLELQENCPEVFGAMEVLVDGGFRRGSDVVKAICLGASAVGLGRPFLHALGYGQEGIERAVQSKCTSR
jgi:L-lactate dehydrogenase (cytochrome)